MRSKQSLTDRLSKETTQDNLEEGTTKSKLYYRSRAVIVYENMEY